MARYLGLGPEDNVVTIATDGMDRYPSVLANLEKRRGPLDDASLSAGFEEIFRAGDARDILDVRPPQQKQRLFGYKEQVWTAFGYTRSYLEEHEVAVLLGRGVRSDPRHRPWASGGAEVLKRRRLRLRKSHPKCYHYL